MTSVEEITELHMSGARAVFRLEAGTEPNAARTAIARAFEDEDMKLETFERLRRPEVAAVYVVDTGVT